MHCSIDDMMMGTRSLELELRCPAPASREHFLINYIYTQSGGCWPGPAVPAGASAPRALSSVPREDRLHWEEVRMMLLRGPSQEEGRQAQAPSEFTAMHGTIYIKKL